MTFGSVGLYLRLRRRLGEPVPVGATLGRAALATAAGAGAAWALVGWVGWDSRPRAVAAIGLALAFGGALYAAVLVVLRTPEVDRVVRSWRSRTSSRRRADLIP